MKESFFSESNIQSLFGHEAAEDEKPERLKQYYFKTSVYEQVSTDLPLRILVGHKGIGKSALFQVAIMEDWQKDVLPILIKPDDIIDLGFEENDFLKTIRKWKNGLLAIIVSKVLTSIGAEERKIKAKIAKYGGNAIDFLHETFKKNLKLDLSASERLIVKNFLENKTINVYIDDLDRGWKGRQVDINRISALLNAVRDITRENKGLNFRIGLRSDVYYLVRTSDESTDKIEGSVIWQTLTNHEIFVILVKRIETFFDRTINEQSLVKKPQKDLAVYLSPIMEARFKGRGHWENAPMYKVIMSLIRKRPRDLVKLLTLAARNAREFKSDKINTSNFENIFAQYSQGRLQDTENEFESELPDISRLLLNMKPNRIERTTKQGFVYKTDALLKKIASIQEMGQFRFSTGRIATTKELAGFMFKTNFLTARKETTHKISRKYFEENRYLSNEFADFGYDWEVHPAYRWALQPDHVNNFFDTLILSHDD